jgi:hypothetical protein
MTESPTQQLGEQAAASYRRRVDEEGAVSVRAGELLASFGHAEGTLVARESVADFLWEAGLRTDPPLATTRLGARSNVKLLPLGDDSARGAPASAMSFEQPGRERWYQQLRWRIAVAVVILLLVFGWRAGAFDDVLVHVGLNAKPCLRNAYGATFCGDSARSYCESLPGEGYAVRMCHEAGDAPIVPPTSATSTGEEPSITTPNTGP